MARQRNYAAEYAARKARAAAKGLSGQAAYGHKKRAAIVEAHKIERAAKEQAGARKALTARQLKAIEKRRKTKTIGQARIVKTSSARRIIDELKAGSKRADRVAIYVVAQVGPKDFRSRVLDGERRSSPKKRAQRGAPSKPPQDVQLVFAPPGHQAWTPEKHGLLPDDVLDLIGGYHDDGMAWDDAVWAALDELVGEAYES